MMNTPRNQPRQENTPPPPRSVASTTLFQSLLANPQVRQLLGIAVVFLAVYVGGALLSAFTSLLTDQSVIEALREESLLEAGKQVDNFMGLFGAILSYYLIFRWFGVAAFLLPALMAMGGTALARGNTPKRFWWWISTGVFFLFWLSLLFGYIVKVSDAPKLAFWCGGIGYGLAGMFDSLFGAATLLALLLSITLFGYFNRWNQLLKPKEKATENFAPEASEKSRLDDLKPESEDEPNLGAISPEFFTDEDESPAEAVAEKEDEETEETNDTEDDFAESKEEDFLANTPKETLGNTPKSGEAQEEIFAEVPENKPLEQENEPSEMPEVTPEATPEESLDEDDPDAVMEAYVKRRSAPDFFDEDVPEHKVDELQNPPEEEEHIPTESERIAALYEAEEFINPPAYLENYHFPSPELLLEHGGDDPMADRKKLEEELEESMRVIQKTLENFRVGISQITAEVGPTVTLYEIVPSEGVKISQIRNLEDDIALNLRAIGIRIIAPMPGRGTIGIEVPNKHPETVSLKPLILAESFTNSRKTLPVVLGKTISNEIFIADLAKMPHLLIGGATGQGKSVGLNVILTSLLYKKHPGELKIVLIDPKKVEFSLYSKLERHFLAKLPEADEAVATDPGDAVQVLESLCMEMDQRYELLKNSDCRQISEYNKKFKEGRLNLRDGHRFMPHVVVVIDELADLMITGGKAVEKPIARLAQLARAIGIHLVVATQRPSVNVITGVIKANFPARMAFRVSSKIDSRVILDATGAEQLIGRGDMLLSNGSEIIRLQCAFMDTPEVENVCDFIEQQEHYAEAYPLPTLKNNEEEEEMDKLPGDDLFS